MSKFCEFRQRELKRRIADLRSTADALQAALEGKPIQSADNAVWHDHDPHASYEAAERPKP